MNQFTPANLIELGRQPQNQQERDKAKRIWAAYRWTWAMYWALGVKQGWKCGICGRSAKNSALNGELDGLNIDHEHFKVQAFRNSISQMAEGMPKWCAIVPELNVSACRGTKQAAIDAVKALALPKSVRGLLCPGRHGKAGRGCCNRLLGRVDNPEWLLKAHNYVIDPPAKGLQI